MTRKVKSRLLRISVKTFFFAKVCSFDTLEEEIESKKRIGYLPENNPLYKEMYIKEYLNFVSSIYKIENKKQRIEQIIQKVILQAEQHKKIGELTGGYI